MSCCFLGQDNLWSWKQRTWRKMLRLKKTKVPLISFHLRTWWLWELFHFGFPIWSYHCLSRWWRSFLLKTRNYHDLSRWTSWFQCLGWRRFLTMRKPVQRPWLADSVGLTWSTSSRSVWPALHSTIQTIHLAMRYELVWRLQRWPMVTSGNLLHSYWK